MSPRKRKADLKAAGEQRAAEALETLAKLMRDSGSDQVKVAAARELLDRAHGKPKAEDGKPESLSLQQMIQRANLLDEDPL